MPPKHRSLVCCEQWLQEAHPVKSAVPVQVEAACRVPWLQEIILEFLEVHGLRQAVALVKGAAKRCVVASPRILKPGEERLARYYCYHHSYSSYYCYYYTHSLPTGKVRLQTQASDVARHIGL